MEKSMELIVEIMLWCGLIVIGIGLLSTPLFFISKQIGCQFCLAAFGTAAIIHLTLLIIVKISKRLKQKRT